LQRMVKGEVAMRLHVWCQHLADHKKDIEEKAQMMAKHKGAMRQLQLIMLRMVKGAKGMAIVAWRTAMLTSLQMDNSILESDLIELKKLLAECTEGRKGLRKDLEEKKKLLADLQSQLAGLRVEYERTQEELDESRHRWITDKTQLMSLKDAHEADRKAWHQERTKLRQQIEDLSETSSRTVVDYHKKNQKEIGARSEVEQEMQKLTEELNNSKENLEKLRTSAEESALEAEQGDKTKENMASEIYSLKRQLKNESDASKTAQELLEKLRKEKRMLQNQLTAKEIAYKNEVARQQKLDHESAEIDFEAPVRVEPPTKPTSVNGSGSTTLRSQQSSRRQSAPIKEAKRLQVDTDDALRSSRRSARDKKGSPKESAMPRMKVSEDLRNSETDATSSPLSYFGM